MKSGWGVAARVAAKVGLTALLFIAIVPSSHADLFGTNPVVPGATVSSGVVPLGPGNLPGTLLASQSAPFSAFTGSDSGTVVSAVYQEAGGTLDFYYQVDLNATAANCGGSGQIACDPLERLTVSSFAGFQTSVGIIEKGSFLGGAFTNGLDMPATVDRNSSGNVVGFDFNSSSGSSSAILPGTDSFVVVVTTDATTFTNGYASVIDSIPSTTGSYAPLFTPVSTPETGTLTLLSSGLLGLGLTGLRRRFRRA
jgi:hypothetical protein